MIDEYLDYIFRSVNPEQAPLYKDATVLIREIDPVVTDMLLNTLAATVENNTTVDNVNGYYSWLINNLCERIEAFGVYLNDDYEYYGALPLLYAVCDSLYRVEHHDNLEEFRTILNDTMATKLAMGEILNAVSSQVATESFCELVSDVSTSLIKRIRDLVADRRDFLLEETDSDDPALRARIKAAMNQYETTGMVRYYQTGGTLGMSFDHYVDYFYRELISLEPVKVARMLKTIGVMANLSGEEFSAKAGESLQNLFADPTKAIQVGRLLRTLPEVEVTNE